MLTLTHFKMSQLTTEEYMSLTQYIESVAKANKLDYGKVFVYITCDEINDFFAYTVTVAATNEYIRGSELVSKYLHTFSSYIHTSSIYKATCITFMMSETPCSVEHIDYGNMLYCISYNNEDSFEIMHPYDKDCNCIELIEH